MCWRISAAGFDEARRDSSVDVAWGEVVILIVLMVEWVEGVYVFDLTRRGDEWKKTRDGRDGAFGALGLWESFVCF